VLRVWNFPANYISGPFTPNTDHNKYLAVPFWGIEPSQLPLFLFIIFNFFFVLTNFLVTTSLSEAAEWSSP